MNPISTFFASLGFFTRMGSCGVLRDEDMGKLAPWLPLVGAVLGVACAIPGVLLAVAGHPVVGGWLVLAASAWLTRGLHLDGLADVADGAGPHADPERFWTIIKDSRSGPFAIGALVLALGTQSAALSDLLSQGRWLAVVLGFAAGRFSCLVLGYWGRDLTRPGLGRKVSAGANGQAILWGAGGLFIASAFTGHVLSALLGVALCVGVSWVLLQLARRVEAINGDFLGASIVLGECVFWVACLL